jgi:hypothetical protein
MKIQGTDDLLSWELPINYTGGFFDSLGRNPRGFYMANPFNG